MTTGKFFGVAFGVVVLVYILIRLLKAFMPFLVIAGLATLGWMAYNKWFKKGSPS